MTVTSDEWRELEQQILSGIAAVDRGSASLSLTQLSEDFVIIHDGARVGRPEYDRLIAARERAPYTSRHIVSNVRIHGDTDHAFRADYIVVVHRIFRDTGELTMSIADFHDLWERNADGDLVLHQRAVTTVVDSAHAQARSVESLDEAT
ncbi:aromatic-ring-hydroxylating dioxygenase subunit beta [Mycobacterium sp. Marseille-P9652]|uniref:aromatic-ring-hydroxylating dioxygenase subunit beta n=1 Tax=Mycobacterium sp. Marseille-P9652 TaxID=2654950 RepID=UPI0018D1A68E|nr:aromatic-ring-hydroxylating dioxygenase subunit beta [Mycobacterium sp. Marseille-P9652]